MNKDTMIVLFYGQSTKLLLFAVLYIAFNPMEFSLFHLPQMRMV